MPVTALLCCAVFRVCKIFESTPGTRPSGLGTGTGVGTRDHANHRYFFFFFCGVGHGDNTPGISSRSVCVESLWIDPLPFFHVFYVVFGPFLMPPFPTHMSLRVRDMKAYKSSVRLWYSFAVKPKFLLEWVSHQLKSPLCPPLVCPSLC